MIYQRKQDQRNNYIKDEIDIEQKPTWKNIASSEKDPPTRIDIGQQDTNTYWRLWFREGAAVGLNSKRIFFGLID